MTTTQKIPASPKKLRSGAWGASAKTSDISVGDVVTITTRAGKTWDAEVTQVIWSGACSWSKNGSSILATRSLDRPCREKSSSRYCSTTRARTEAPKGWSPCGYPGCHWSYCDDCDGRGYLGYGRDGGCEY